MGADLTKYFVGPANAKMSIEAKVLFAYVGVGSGTFTAYGPKLIEFKGEITKMASAKFDLKLEVADDKRCTVTLNGTKQDAGYAESGGELVVTIPSGAEKGTITIKISDGGTWIDPEIAGGHTIRIVPA